MPSEGKCAKCHVSGHFAVYCAKGKGKNKDGTSNNNKSFRGQHNRHGRQKQYQQIIRQVLSGIDGVQNMLMIL